MVGPVGYLYCQSVNGMNVLALSESDFTHNVKATPFVAKKFVKIRDELLSAPS